MLVSTEWLSARLNDSALVVLHVARNRADYDAGHIPGAQFVGWNELTTTREGITNELPPAADLAKLFERCGVSRESRIVLYGDSRGLSAARAYFTLDYLGLGSQAALLDGGIEKWRAEQRPVSREETAAKPGRVEPLVNQQIVVTLEEMRALSKQASAALIDSRPAADFASGHIPGARNVFWSGALASGDVPVLRPVAEIERMYASAGTAGGSTVVTYCNSGVQAAYGYFTLKYLGFNVRLYDGSFSEWSKAPGAEVEKTAPVKQ